MRAHEGVRMMRKIEMRASLGRETRAMLLRHTRGRDKLTMTQNELVRGKVAEGKYGSFFFFFFW